MKKNHLMSIVEIILLASLVGCSPATTSAESTSMPEPYTVDLTPADFVAVVDNPYFPLIPGSKWVYETKLEDGSTEQIHIEVLQEKREIMGVQATVVHDTVHVDDQIVEDTNDWYAQDKDGNVWYLGETVDNYEDGVLVDHKGSWEWGVDGALPGIVMWADPSAHVNEVYRQEYYPREAEDQGKVLSVSESVTVPFGSFENVVKTSDFSSLDPDLQEEKYYAEGIGVIKTNDLTTGEEEVLVEYTPSGGTAVLSLPTAPENERVELVESTFSNLTNITVMT